MRAALYARVSLAEDRQNPAIQTDALTAWAAALGHEVVATYVDRVSGATRTRPGLDQMLDDASRHRFDIVLVAALDRVSRGGAYQLLKLLNALTEHGVEIRSQREPWLSTAGPIAEVLVAVLGFVAQMERNAIRERQKANARYLQSVGRRVNRHTLWAPPNVEDFERYLRLGRGICWLGRHYEVQAHTIRRYLARSAKHEAMYLNVPLQPVRMRRPNGVIPTRRERQEARATAPAR